MSAPDLSREQLAVFSESGAQKHVTLLLGAGASTSSGLPTWDALAERLLVSSRVVESVEAARLLVEKQDPLLVAEAAKQSAGASWEQLVRASLYDGVVELAPSELHVAAAGHTLASEPGATTLLTLNSDTLLESAFDGSDDRGAEWSVDGTVTSAVHTVHHLHGLVSTSEVSGVVLTLSDFNELLGDAQAWQLRIVREAVGRGALLIAGTSYRDPDLRRWLHVALADRPAGHRALVLLARQGFELDRENFAKVKGALVAQWQAVGLEPVVVEDFADAAQVLQELRHIHGPGYMSPQERARAVWDAHEASFEHLQRAYSMHLATEAEAMRGALGVTHLNLTLWLADGRGRLARWAAHDRVYKSMGDLRLVASGHDSRWIAGRVLSGENLLFEDLRESDGMRRWSTVLAVQIRVEHSSLPGFATAALTVGLPGNAATYARSRSLWFDTILDIANAWSERLVEVVSPATSGNL